MQNGTYNSSDIRRLQTLMGTSINQVMLHHQGLYHGGAVNGLVCITLFSPVMGTSQVMGPKQWE
jgi:hypothetical protein